MRWLALVLTILVIVGSLLGSATITKAHPGGTDGNGCHTCRTNCTERWGISYGFYHRHHPVRPCFASLEPVEPIEPTPPIQPIIPIIPTTPTIPTPRPNELPSVFLSGTGTIEEDEEARFSAAAHDDDGFVTRYHWTFGDGTSESSTSDTITHKFSSPGMYKVTVTAIDNDGGRTSDTHLVDVEGRKWPLSQGLMTGIVLGSLAGLFVIYVAVSAIVDARRSARR